MNRIRTVIRKVAAILRGGDMFSTSQFLRYRGESDYGTVTGGLTSVAVIIFFVILFANLGVETASRKLITSSVSQESEINPSPLEVVIGPNGGFTFVVGVLGLNLNDPMVSYFDITLTQYFFGTLLTPINATRVPLEQCTPQHFAFNSNIASYFQRFTIDWALCPPVNYTLNVGGRLTSDIFSHFTVQIAKCNGTANPRCAPGPMMAAIQQQLGFFRLGVPMVSALINPGDQEYVKYYVEDGNTFFFTVDSQAVSAVGEVAQIKVETDMSLMPYTDIKTEYFIGVPEQFRTQSIPILNDIYAQVTFRKAATFPVYTRSFSKVDDFLSYVGGLISTVILLFFVLSAYSALAYCLEIASSALLVASGKSVPSGSFNFLHFVMVGVKDLLSRCCGGPSWPVIDEFRRCRDQAQKQLDVSYILSRINFLENAVAVELKQHQLTALHLKAKPTIEEADRSRLKHKALAVIRRAGGRKDRTSISASIELNESSESPKKAQMMPEEDEEQYCDFCQNSSDDEGFDEMVGELQGSYNQLACEPADRISKNILKGIDEQVHQRLKTQGKPLLAHGASVNNLDCYSFQEIEYKPTDLNGKGAFQFIA